MGNINTDLQKIIDDLNTKRNPNNCAACGQVNTWSDNQYRRNCCRCGTVLVRTDKMPRIQTECWICMDDGIVIYKGQTDGMVGEYAAACTCRKGDEALTYYKDGTPYLSDKIPRIHQTLMAPPLQVIILKNKQMCKTV